MNSLLNLPQEIIGQISGADYQKQQAAQAYQNALDQLGPGGTAAASKYGRFEQAALQPQFNAQDKQLAAKEAAQGIGPSGAAKADYADLSSQQAATLAGAEAPLFSQGLGAYTGLIGAEPGAENQAYQQALSQFYGAVGAAAGAPSMPQSVQAAPAPGGNYAQGYTPTGDAGPLNYNPYVSYSQQAPANQNPYGPQQ